MFVYSTVGFEKVNIVIIKTNEELKKSMNKEE